MGGMREAVQITQALAIPADEVEIRAVRASGPGGQNVNKVSSKIELRFHVENSRALSPAQKARLLHKLAGRLTVAGELLIQASEYREQRMNLEAATSRFAACIRQALAEPKRRRATK